MTPAGGPAPQAPHVKIGDYYFRIDEDAEVPFRRISDSLMQPRTDVSGIPGAINLQRDVWLWTMSDFVGGEGREVFDSSDPLGPPTFFKTDGGVDCRVRGEFSLHPDESLVANTTGGGSAPTSTVWSNGATGGDFTTVSGAPTYDVGPNANRVRLNNGDKVRAPARTPGTNVVRVTARFIQARTTPSNKQVSVKFEVWNNTDSLSVEAKTKTIKENEPTQIQIEFTGTAAKTYHYRASNEDSSPLTVQLAKITEDSYGIGPAGSQDIRALQLGINDNVWGLTFDGTNTDVLRWDFTNDDWDQIVSNMNAGVPRALAGSDQYMYALLDNGRIYRINGSGATYYAEPPTTAGVGEELGLAVANNRLYALYDQALFELTLDSTSAGLPFTEAEADYLLVVAPGEMPKELSPVTTQRQHISALPNGVRWYINQRGGQSVIYEFGDGAASSKWHLPMGFIATAIHHYANITFISASFTNAASSPAETRAGIYYIGSDQLLRFLGYLRFTETNSQDVAYMTSYGHDVYFLQGRRIWRYNLGSGGLTLENVTSQNDESKSRALARMDKKFWAAVEGEGTFVADDAYPTQTMWLYSPVWDFDLPDLQKVLLSFDVVTRPLPANTRFDVEYRVDEAATWTSTDGAGATMSQEVDDAVKTRFTISNSTATKKFSTLQWRVGLTSLNGTDTPRVLSVTARGYVLEYEDGFDLTVLLDDDTSTDRLRSEQLTGRQKAGRLWTYKTAKNLLAFEDHYSAREFADKDSYTVVIEDPFQELVERGKSSIRLKLKVLS